MQFLKDKLIAKWFPRENNEKPPGCPECLQFQDGNRLRQLVEQSEAEYRRRFPPKVFSPVVEVECIEIPPKRINLLNETYPF